MRRWSCKNDMNLRREGNKGALCQADMKGVEQVQSYETNRNRECKRQQVVFLYLTVCGKMSGNSANPIHHLTLPMYPTAVFWVPCLRSPPESRSVGQAAVSRRGVWAKKDLASACLSLSCLSVLACLSCEATSSSHARSRKCIQNLRGSSLTK